ncbi:MAG: hypothetical protein HYS25_06195 [Ignavibacteriales bacterium]|nr:hypothetical protein [Ignavibacteriales bacterium]
MFVLTLWIVFNNKHENKRWDLYGTWIGKRANVEVKFMFNKDGSCELNFTDLRSSSNTILTGTYVVDFSKKPIPVAIKSIVETNYSLYTIVEFFDRDLIKLEMFSTRWRARPIVFGADTSMLLKRIR